MTHLTVETACPSADEAILLQAVIDDRMDTDAKHVYADWLDEHGDSGRASFMRQTATAFESMKIEDFPTLDNLPRSWVNMIGARLLRAIAAGLGELRDQLLPISKPALRFEFEADADPELEHDSEIEVGGTKIFGLPDLPPGTPWPRQRDCKHLYDPDSGIDPNLPCGFVCQLNLADLAGTQFGRGMPDTGLLSVFSCSEIEEIGMTDTLVMYTADVTNLVRHSAPEELEDDEANQILDAQRGLRLYEALELPTPSQESKFPQVQWSYDDPRSDPYDRMLEEADSDSVCGIGGFTRPTSGDSYLPGQDFCRLICIDNTLEIRLHFVINEAELAAGNFDSAQCWWIDFD